MAGGHPYSGGGRRDGVVGVILCVPVPRKAEKFLM